MQTVTFGEWLPDQPGITGALTEAFNVIPLAVGYGPLPSVAEISTAAGSTLNGVFAGRFAGDTTLFASAGDAVYKYDNSNLTLTDVSKVGGYSGSRWNFAQFGRVVLASNGAEKIQAWTLGTSTAFADVDATAPAVNYLTVVRDFVVGANTTANPNRVFWSDINDETDWTPGATSQSDTQDIADGGNIQGVVGGEFGLILAERSISRMTYAGAPLYFQFDTISRGLGCLEPNSIAQYGAVTFFLSDDGFYQCDGQSVTPIGAEKVDRFFFNDVSLARINEMSAAVDPVRRCVFWCYPNSRTGARSFLIYNWNIKKWTRADTDAQYIATAATNSLTLEDLDNFSSSIDALGISLDSRFWVGDKLLLAGVVDDKIVTFSGANSDAEIITGDIGGGSNSMIRLAKPQIDSGSASVAVASRARLDAAISFGSTATTSTENRASLRSHGRYHRLKVVPSGLWTNAVAVDVDVVGAGAR